MGDGLVAEHVVQLFVSVIAETLFYLRGVGGCLLVHFLNQFIQLILLFKSHYLGRKQPDIILNSFGMSRMKEELKSTAPHN